ncbi:hypothetical protein BJY04DRAFT_215092 [Aspergillus karnatakaensis]|uniref:uncharacterized protein n=1 Tax=Aspergillus karnatakaensis TaxID=1810916 RepID=UPI003CCD2AA7
MSSPSGLDQALTNALRDFAQTAGLPAGITPASPSEVFQITEDANKKFLSSSSSAGFSQKLSPCLQTIARFSPVVDSLTQFDPSPSSLVWGSLKLLLQGALQYASYLEKLGEMFEEFGQFFPVVEEYEEIFKTSDVVQLAVVHLYTNLVQFFTRAVRFLKKKPRDLIFRTIVKPFEHDYSQILRNYQNHRSELQAVAIAAMEKNARQERQLAEAARSAATEERKQAQEERQHALRERQAAEEERRKAGEERAAAAAERKDSLAERQRAEAAREDLRKEIEDQGQERNEALVERITAQKSRDGVVQEAKTQQAHRTVVESQLQGLHSGSVLRWLNPSDYESTLTRMTRQREQNTLVWIFQQPEYAAWIQNKNWKRDTLWIYGAPGTGKTVLAATILEGLRDYYTRHNVQQTTQYAVCYFFFDSNSALEQPEAAMLRALVAQLLNQDKELEPLNQIYTDRSAVHATLSDLREAFAQLVPDFSGVYVVIDGLDELPDAADVLQLLLALLVQVSPVMKLLVLSRPEPDIKRFFFSHPQFEITESLTKDDIRQVVAARVEAACKEKKIRTTDPKLKEEIIDALVSSSSGEFLWATMQVKRLQTLRVQTDRILRAALRNLPSGVADLYGQILSKINSYAEEDRVLAEDLLQWVVGGRRPLSVAELCSALALEVGELELSIDNIPANTDEIIDACGPLLSIGDEGVVRLVHSTVANFLLDSSKKGSSPEDVRRYFIDQKRAHSMMAKKCLSYLSVLTFRDRISKSKTLAAITPAEVSSYPLLEYAASNWWRHVVNSSTTEDTAKMVLDLMLNLAKSTQGLSWLEISITLANSVDHIQILSTQINSWLRRLEFAHESLDDLRQWLKELVDLARFWESVLRESPFELRSTVKKFGREGSFFHRHFGTGLTGNVATPQVKLPGYNDPLDQGDAFDILVDEEEGYVLHPSGNLRLHFTWYVAESRFLAYAIYCENPTTKRQYKRVVYGHPMIYKSSNDYQMGLHTVAFSPDGNYMAVATVMSVRGLHKRETLEKSTISVWLWQLRNLESPAEEALVPAPWTSDIPGYGQYVFKGFVGQSDFAPFWGSRSAIAFGKVGSTMSLFIPGKVFNIRTGASLSQPEYLENIVSQRNVNQCTFTPDGRHIFMVRNHSTLESVDIDGSNGCRHDFPGWICEINAVGRTGRSVILWLTESRTNLPSQEKQARLVAVDTVTNTSQSLLSGIEERRYDEVKFNLRGWQSWSEWVQHGSHKFVPQGLIPIRPDRHCNQVYSIFNWMVGGEASDLYIEPDIDFPIKPSDQRWWLSQLFAPSTELSLSSSATYLFSDKTIRLPDGSFVLSVGYSNADKYICTLTSKQRNLLPSSVPGGSTGAPSPEPAANPASKPAVKPLATRSTVPPPASRVSLGTAPPASNSSIKTYTRFFDNNRKLGCLQITYSGTRGRYMDLMDYVERDIPQRVDVRVFIWDLHDSLQLLRKQALELTPAHRSMLSRPQYRRLDVAFHPAGDRIALFNTVYDLETGFISEYKIFDPAKIHPDIVARRTFNAWQISFSADGEYIAFAVTAGTRAPGLFGRRGEISNIVILFEIDKPDNPICSNISTKGGDTLSMGSCSAVFHPSEKRLLWTSLFVYTDATTETVTKLLNFDQAPYEAYHITDCKYDEFKFGPGKHIYGHPSRTGKPGYYDRLGAGEPQPTSLMKTDTIQFAAIDRTSRHAVGIIPHLVRPDHTIFMKRSIVPLPPHGRLPHNNMKVLRRDRNGITKDYVVVLHFDDDRAMSEENGEEVVKPVLISVDVAEVSTRPITSLAEKNNLDNVYPLLVQETGVVTGQLQEKPQVQQLQPDAGFGDKGEPNVEVQTQAQIPSVPVPEDTSASDRKPTPTASVFAPDTPAVGLPEEEIVCILKVFTSGAMDEEDQKHLIKSLIEEFNAAGYTPEHIKSVLDKQDQLERQSHKPLGFEDGSFEDHRLKFIDYKYDRSKATEPQRAEWIRIHRKHLLPETLHAYHILWEWDEVRTSHACVPDVLYNDHGRAA